MIHVVKNGAPTYANGALNLQGGEEFNRVQSLRAELGFIREMTGTQLHALRITIVRDALQGTEADMLAYSTMYGANGRAQKSIFPLRVLIVDDVRNGQPALVGTIVCEHALIAGISRVSGKQVLTFLASKWHYLNAGTGLREPADANLVPVELPDFLHTNNNN